MNCTNQTKYATCVGSRQRLITQNVNGSSIHGADPLHTAERRETGVSLYAFMSLVFEMLCDFTRDLPESWPAMIIFLVIDL